MDESANWCARRGVPASFVRHLVQALRMAVAMALAAFLAYHEETSSLLRTAFLAPVLAIVVPSPSLGATCAVAA
jgi:hypothetical protein